MGSLLSFAGVQEMMVGDDVSSQVGETAADAQGEERTSDTLRLAMHSGVGVGGQRAFSSKQCTSVCGQICEPDI